jgi:ubiquinone/menaquinone biosynthesis C-methylase UbiE
VTEYLDDMYDVADPEFVSVYDELPLWSAMFGQVLLEHVPLRPNLKVLDVGCGTGFPALELAGRLGPSCRVYAIDPWKPAITRAEQKLEVLRIPNVRLFAGDAAAMPFGAGEFDLIVSNLGINNFDRPEAVLGECWRVAKPSALLALTTNLRGHMRKFYELFRTTLTELGKDAQLKALQAHVEHRVTVEGASGMLEMAGFRVRRVHQQTFTMRFLDGTALLRHAFIKIGFLDAWRCVVDGQERQAVFAQLEKNLNHLAGKLGELALTIPMAYLEAEKVT